MMCCDNFSIHYGAFFFDSLIFPTKVGNESNNEVLGFGWKKFISWKYLYQLCCQLRFFFYISIYILLLLQLFCLYFHNFSVYLIENLYQSLYDDLNQYNDTNNAFNF